MTASGLRKFDPDTHIGLDQLACHLPAEVVGLALVEGDEDRSMALRLLEIGFLPGETVRVIAHGYPGHDPLAVRVGHTTFALRRHEAALVRVNVPSVRRGVGA
jgi:ferrous iron transport protein A